MSEIDPAEYQERLDRISDIFAGMVSHAETTTQHRCPYRDRHDHCTALFACRNQQPNQGDLETLICGHDGVFDYRDAWESHPRNQERMQRKIRNIRLKAQHRRSKGEPGIQEP